MMTLQDKNDVLRDALMSISRITARGFRDAIGASEEEKYDCHKSAFDEIAKVVTSVVRRDLFGDEPPKKSWVASEVDRKRTPDEARERFGKFLSIPALGMQFRRYRSANTTILVATWRDQKECNSHVYVLRVERDGDTPNCGWRATATNDGHVVFQLRAKCRSNCEHFAFSAMKRYLKRGHRRTYRTIAKAKEEK